MDSTDPFAPATKPCHCHDNDPVELSADPLAGPMPTVSDVEAALAELGGAAVTAAPESLELEFAALDDALSSIDAFELERASSLPAVGLEDLLALAERYPGLKVTLSF